MGELTGQVALVTGAGGGIGSATARELGRRGASVAINYRRSRDGAEAVAREIADAGGRAAVFRGDVTDAESVDALIGGVERDLGPIDILVCNAGDLIARRTLAEMTAAQFREVMEVNVTSTFLCTKAAAAVMVPRRRGSIVTMSSLAAHNGGGPGAFAYAAAKAAIIGMTKGLAKELAPSGIRVNCVSPGLIGATNFHGRFTAPDAFAAMEKGVPIGRAGTPDEVARVIAFLAGRDAAYLTGETIEINGGLLMR
jgi:3-oxoacyl-[acyl-carrier protein] reductase